MTYNVFGGMLNLAQSRTTYQRWVHFPYGDLLPNNRKQVVHERFL